MMPWAINSPQAFAAKGYAVPTTWDEMKSAAQALTHDDVYGIGCFIRTWLGHALRLFIERAFPITLVAAV